MKLQKAWDLQALKAELLSSGMTSEALKVLEAELKMGTPIVADWVRQSLVLEGGIKNRFGSMVLGWVLPAVMKAIDKISPG